VLICDLAMSVRDGFDVLHAVRARDRDTGRKTRAIALTAHASPEYRVRAREEAFEGHLLKPIESDQMLQVVLGASTL
jgi:ATP-binding cassette subfamily B protein